MNNLTELREISLLGEDWDGFGALPVHPQAIAFTDNLIKNVMDDSEFSLSPNPNGTISLEWETPKLEAHLAIGSTQYSMYINSVDSTFETLYFSGTLKELESQWSIIENTLTSYK